MREGHLEHVNITVSDCHATAAMCETLFGWRIRWSGDAIDGGHSIHVGTEDRYLAVYTPPETTEAAHSNYVQKGGLNHVGVVVEDLAATEEKVRALGFSAGKHQDYAPGRRFYFNDRDGIEWEVVSYD